MFIQQLKARKDYQGYFLSFVFAVLLALHLISSDIVVAGKAQQKPDKTIQSHIIQPSQVQVKVIEQEFIEKELQLYGRTQPNKVLKIKAERAAKVISLVLDQGHKVSAGMVLMRLDQDNLVGQLKYAKALVKQRELEYDSALHLQEKGHQAKLIVAQKSTQLAEAQADLQALQKQKQHTIITSPIAGILNTTFVEQGDFVQTGEAVAEILELNPLIVNIHVPETAISELNIGQVADVRFLDGMTHQATVTYIAASSNMGTNTFQVELRLANKDYKIPAGISTTVVLKTQRLPATAISPAYLSLNEEGESGIYVVENGLATFKKADILKSNAKKLWVDGLGEKAKVIVVGHQGILDGSPVELFEEQQPNNLTF